MKVVLKHTILDRIRKDIEDAKRNNRVPDYIVVTPEEYKELLDVPYVRNALLSNSLLPYRPSMAEFDEVRNATFRTFDFEKTDRGHYGPPVLRAASHENLMGYPLVVVPKEYHPR